MIVDLATREVWAPCTKCGGRGVQPITDRGVRIALLCKGCVAHIERRCARRQRIVDLLVSRGVDERMARRYAGRWAL